MVNFFKKNSPKEAQTLHQKKTWNSGPIYKLINLGTMLVSMSSFISEKINNYCDLIKFQKL